MFVYSAPVSRKGEIGGPLAFGVDSAVVGDGVVVTGPNATGPNATGTIAFGVDSAAVGDGVVVTSLNAMRAFAFGVDAAEAAVGDGVVVTGPNAMSAFAFSLDAAEAADAAVGDVAVVRHPNPRRLVAGGGDAAAVEEAGIVGLDLEGALPGNKRADSFIQKPGLRVADIDGQQARRALAGGGDNAGVGHVIALARDLDPGGIGPGRLDVAVVADGVVAAG